MWIALKVPFHLGLNKVCEEGIRIDNIGIDTGVDFVLLDKQGQRVGLPVAYRDTAPMACWRQAQQQLGKRDVIAAAAFSFCRLTRFISCVR